MEAIVIVRLAGYFFVAVDRFTRLATATLLRWLRDFISERRAWLTAAEVGKASATS
jgi:hypothetical protein